MPPYNWPKEPIEVIQEFESRHSHPDAGALLTWAAMAVECLHYLDDVDRTFDVSQTTVAGHRPDIVDVAHARWATSTCITALDLCAAWLGRAFCGYTGAQELKLANFNNLSIKPSQQKRVQARRDQLPPRAQQWLDDVLTDSDYKVVKSARDWLTHSRVKRHFVLNAGGPPERLLLELPPNKLPVRQLVEITRDLATRRVSELLRILPHL